jgi:ADP-heptose:LPS heptosyltransferase
LKHRTAATAASIAYRALNGVLRAASALLWPGARPRGARRICVFRIGNIGDIVCALPAMRAVREAYPEARLTLLTSPGARGMPGASDVLRGADWIDEVRVYHTEDIDTHAKRAALLRELRSASFDLWIDLPNNLTSVSRQFRDMIFARMTGVRWARGWRIDTLRWAAQAQSECLSFPNEVDRMLDTVRRLGIVPRLVDFALPRSAPWDGTAHQQRLVSAAQRKPLVAIAPGAKRTTNLWMTDRFAAVGAELARAGYHIVLIGGAGEAPVCERIAREVGRSATSFAGALSLAESSELIRRCKLVVCLDSGVQHVAAAVGTPVVSLFSFWQMRGKWRPHGKDNVVIQKWVDCHTCLLDNCPNHNRCMKAIRVSEVVAHARRLLDRRATEDARTPNEPANHEANARPPTMAIGER